MTQLYLNTFLSKFETFICKFYQQNHYFIEFTPQCYSICIRQEHGHCSITYTPTKSAAGQTNVKFIKLMICTFCGCILFVNYFHEQHYQLLVSFYLTRRSRRNRHCRNWPFRLGAWPNKRLQCRVAVQVKVQFSFPFRNIWWSKTTISLLHSIFYW